MKNFFFILSFIYSVTLFNFPVYGKMDDKSCKTLENWIIYHYKKSRTAWDKLDFDSSKKGMSNNFYLDGFKGNYGMTYDNYKNTKHNVNRKKWDFHERQATALSPIYTAVCK